MLIGFGAIGSYLCVLQTVLCYSVSVLVKLCLTSHRIQRMAASCRVSGVVILHRIKD